MKSEAREIGTASLSLRNPDNSLVSNPTAALNNNGRTTQLGSLDSGCIEKLLLHCAAALEANDVTLAQQVMWVLNNVASPSGDPNQRLTSWLLRALVSRASGISPAAAADPRRRLMSVVELAGYVDLIPWHRFGYCASNAAILHAVRGCREVHVLDFSITHCMQWPTFIDALAKIPEGPPLLRITVPLLRPRVPPLLDATCEEVGQRLVNFSALRQVPFEFNVIPNSNNNNNNTSTTEDNYTSELEFLLSQLRSPKSLSLRDGEALVVNFQNWLRYLPHDHRRDAFLGAVRGLNPRIVVVVDEDFDLISSPSLATRIGTCFNHMWIPFDALGTFSAAEGGGGGRRRSEYESDIGQRIENIVGFEGERRIERSESGAATSRRMRSGGFESVPFAGEAVEEVKGLLGEHASGWGVKTEEDMLVLTWKGHNSVFATAWVPG